MYNIMLNICIVLQIIMLIHIIRYYDVRMVVDKVSQAMWNEI